MGPVKVAKVKKKPEPIERYGSITIKVQRLHPNKNIEGACPTIVCQHIVLRRARQNTKAYLRIL